MRRLLGVEFSRLTHRRVVLAVLLLTVLLAPLVAAKSAWDSRPPSAAEVATARAQADIDAGRSDVRAELQDCLSDPVCYLGPEATAQSCRETLEVSTEVYLPRVPLDLSGTLRGNGLGLAVLVVGLMLVLGAIAAGTDATSGALATQLLFEPRRERLWAGRAAAVAVLAALTVALSLGLFWITLDQVAASRGLAHGGDTAGEIVPHVLRAIALGAAAAGGAFAVTILFGRASATLTAVFLAAVGGEMLITLLPLDAVTRWTVGTNVEGWLATDLAYLTDTGSCLRLGSCPDPVHLSHWGAGGYLLVLLIGVCVASLATFRRRDL